MFYGDAIGLDKVYARVLEFRDRFGAANWTPAPLLETLAKAGKSLNDWYAAQSAVRR
jgi:3-hydroxyacyl-CoA dehydrogenase